MSEATLHTWATYAELGLAVLTFAALLFVTAPYGRSTRPGWGPTIPSRLGWVLMESPALLVWLAIYATGEHRAEAFPLALAALWSLHYGHRVIVYPLRMRMTGKRMPLVIALLAIVFNLLNAYVNARWVSALGDYSPADFTRPTFVLGAALFLFGFGLNLHSDEVLRRLRRPGETGYRIPQAGLHKYVAAPNYFAEIMEWVGWALAVNALAGWAFAAYTFANLAPRAVSHLRWYRETFEDYPASRRALVPFIW